MKIYGKVIADKDEWLTYHGTLGVNGIKYYALGIHQKDGVIKRHDYDTGTAIAGCSGKANQLLGKPYYDKDKDVMSWGYEGFGSDLTAAWLITQSLYLDKCSCVMGENESSQRDYKEYYEPIIEVMRRHYKQFSVEVIANLPDEWEMDTEWIKAWVMEREQQLQEAT